MPDDRLARIDDRSDRDDPRLNPDFWRGVPGDGARTAAVLVGVVHDHPASRHRVDTLARAFEPDVLALELPDLAVPHYERVARARGASDRADDGDTPGSAGDDGGEMSAAIAARPSADAVGIDTVGPSFLARLGANAVAERASPSTLRRTLAEVAAIAGDAVAHRIGRGDPGGSPVAHGVAAGDPPTDQAADERTHVARSRSLLGAIERPHADLLLDGTREENMAARIDALRRDGAVLAVVGMDHLDAVTAAVERRGRARGR